MSDVEKFKWEVIECEPIKTPKYTLPGVIFRSEVPGGWLVIFEKGEVLFGSPLYVPDPDHKWLKSPAAPTQDNDKSPE